MESQEKFLKTMENWANIYLFRSLLVYFDYISEICAHTLVSPAAASQMVDRLEKLDMVERIADPEDRRVRNVVLSAEGKNIVQNSIKARQSWIKDIPVRLKDDQLDEISAALQLLISTYQE